jgi:hypothetical protein
MDGQNFIAVLRGAGLEPRSYSGRGMFGRQCVGVSGRTVASVLRDVPREFGEPHTDNMGMGVIAYWPSVEWPDATIGSVSRGVYPSLI